MYRFGARPLLLAFVLVSVLQGAGVTGTEWTLRLPPGLQEQAAYIPEDNPLTLEKIALGKQLFWDKRWSRNGTVACVSCHDPKHGWADPRQFSLTFEGKRLQDADAA
jgi:cytochrome c peroxidase